MVKSFGKDRLISVMINFGKDTMNSEEIKPRTKKDIDNLIISMRKQRENWLQIKNCE